MSEERIEEAFSSFVDVNMTPELYEGSPIASSGVSSGGNDFGASQHVHHASPEVSSSSAGVFKCREKGCVKEYKTKKGFEKHLFVHKIQGMNSSKPDTTAVAPIIEDLIIQILKEISSERSSGSDKKSFVDQVLELIETDKKRNWVQFVSLLADPVLDFLCSTTKLLPSNQYEQSLAAMTCALNDATFTSRVKTQLLMLCSNPERFEASRIPGMVVFRLCFRLLEEVQCFLVQEMRPQTSLGSSVSWENQPTADMSEDAKEAFEDHANNIFRKYYEKGCTIQTPIWQARCKCFRHRFLITSLEEEDCNLSNVILNPLSWKSNEGSVPTIRLSDNLLKFLHSLESIIQSTFREFAKISTDIVLDCLFKPVCRNVLETWHSITTGYLSEVDSLVLMREIVCIFTSLSSRLEADKIRREEEKNRNLQKFGLRSNLQRN